MWASTNRCYNERGSRTNQDRSSIPHCITDHITRFTRGNILVLMTCLAIVTLRNSGWACQFSLPLTIQLISTRVTNQVTGTRHANRISYQFYRTPLPRRPLHTMRRHCYRSPISFWPAKNLAQLRTDLDCMWVGKRRGLMDLRQPMRFAIAVQVTRSFRLKFHWPKFSKLTVSPTKWIKTKGCEKQTVRNSSKFMTGPVSYGE
jgi:hypothetical protein